MLKTPFRIRLVYVLWIGLISSLSLFLTDGKLFSKIMYRVLFHFQIKNDAKASRRQYQSYGKVEADKVIFDLEMEELV
ncbi:hypothetical protein AAW31_18425 [Nitrosomonas communis]|uniref:Uncharacterized protein n=1 Tax=Nitrosomonas communis TaxID=44574 RepID=A0A0F7KKL8_9PROT|nr:hypothetical protein AAW31_18425 [Nitrosomonas communis]